MEIQNPKRLASILSRGGRKRVFRPVGRLDIGEADWFSKEFGGSSPSLWRRGKRISIGTTRMLEAWTEPTLVSGGKARVAGRRWKPLKVVQVGCDVSEYRSNRPSRIVESGVGSQEKLHQTELSR